MSTLADLRADLVSRLAGVIDTYDHVPESLPGGVIAVIDAADEDYLSVGETYHLSSEDAEVWVAFKVYVLADLQSNAQATGDLDAALGPVVVALASAGDVWEMGPVGKPGPFHTLNWLAYGAAITVRTITTLTKE